MKGNFNCRLIPGLLILTLLLSMGFAPHGGGASEVEVVSIDPNSKSGWPGENVTFVITVKNAGQTDDKYIPTATSMAGWILQINPALLTLAAGASGEATLRVKIPSDASGNTLMHVDVDVRSVDNIEHFSIGRCTVLVLGIEEEEIPYLVILFAILVIVGAVLVARWLSHKIKRGGPKRILWEARKF